MNNKKFDKKDPEFLNYVRNNISDILTDISENYDDDRYVRKNLTITDTLNKVATACKLNFSECLRHGVKMKLNEIYGRQCVNNKLVCPYCGAIEDKTDVSEIGCLSPDDDSPEYSSITCTCGFAVFIPVKTRKEAMKVWNNQFSTNNDLELDNDALWEKCKQGGSITAQDLGINKTNL